MQAKQGTLSVPGTSEASTVPETDRKIFTDWRWAALLHGLVVVVLTVVVSAATPAASTVIAAAEAIVALSPGSNV